MVVHLRSLFGGLPGLGCDCRLAGPQTLVEDLGVAGDVLEIRDRPSPLADLAAAHRLSGLIAKAAPSLVHAHGYRAAWIASLANRQGRPLIVTLHNLFPRSPGRLASAAVRRIVRQSSGVIGISRATLDSVALSLAPPRVGRPAGDLPALPYRWRVIPNGIQPPEGLPARVDARTRLGLGADEPVLLLVGRLMANKGVDVALRALAGWPHPRPRLMIAGDGPDRAMLEELSQSLAVQSRVSFVGWEKELRPLLAAADLMLAPSRAEGQSLVILEAMAAGLPVVASAVGGIVESIRDGETGVLVPPEDPSALAEAVMALLVDPDRRSGLAEAARRFVLEERTESGMVDATLALYHEVLGAANV
jgi:glycosyltransferase involved in cell wall biosynthesis